MRPKRDKWTEWTTPSEDEQILLAKILLPHIKILSPDIVKLIVEDNNKNLSNWTAMFQNIGIRPDIYLWENSPVTFPGIRRHAGSKEITSFNDSPKKAKGNNALVLDDNAYPKELWSYVIRNSKYDRTNPPNYSLAHIVDHKDYKTRNNDELKGFEKTEDKNLFAGLYTSCVNTVWVPNSLLKPTDHKGKLRKLLIQIIDKYYGSICTVLPHKLSFNLDNIEENWQLENFPKPTIVGNVDNIANFIQFRNDIIEEKIKNYS